MLDEKANFNLDIPVDPSRSISCLVFIGYVLL